MSFAWASMLILSIVGSNVWNFCFSTYLIDGTRVQNILRLLNNCATRTGVQPAVMLFKVLTGNATKYSSMCHLYVPKLVTCRPKNF
jgi:hypothetical protein